MQEDSALTVVVETSDGVYLRRVRPARVLPGDGDLGEAAEGATRHAAALWGLPDFVFRAAVRRKGSGVRELGDTIILVGEVAAVIQVKARTAWSGEQERERSWLDKRIDKAARQAIGTIRAFNTNKSSTLINERGRHVHVNGTRKSWVPVVVIDHPGIDDYIPSAEAVVLLRQDWEFLFEQLKLTDAVIRYLHRVRDLDPNPLGNEAVRYYELAAADVAAELSELDSRLLRPGAERMSTPILPQAPAGFSERPHHLLVRIILEDIARARHPKEVVEADILDVLAAIDTLPVAYRGQLGKDVLSWLRDVMHAAADSTKWRFRLINLPGRPHLIFAAASRHNEIMQASFASYVSLRHQQLIEAIPELSKIMTVGVLLAPRRDGLRDWDTTMIATSGDQGFGAAYRAQLEGLWGQPGVRDVAS